MIYDAETEIKIYQMTNGAHKYCKVTLNQGRKVYCVTVIFTYLYDRHFGTLLGFIRLPFLKRVLIYI